MIINKHEINLKIAGFNIRLFINNLAYNLSIDNGYNQFKTTETHFSVEIEINPLLNIKNFKLSKNNLVFSANTDKTCLWKVYKEIDFYTIVVFNQSNPELIQQIAQININKNRWKIFSIIQEDNKTIIPLAYPMGPLILYYLTTKFDAIMIHASGVNYNGNGLLFSGFSGTGKSTMANLWSENNCQIINDDRLIIRKEKNSYKIYNTPMFYDDVQKSIELKGIYLIKHHIENTIERLNGALAVSKLTAFCIQHPYDKNFLEHHLEFISDLINYIPIYDLGFKPNNDVIDFIKKNHK